MESAYEAVFEVATFATISMCSLESEKACLDRERSGRWYCHDRDGACWNGGGNPGPAGRQGDQIGRAEEGEPGTFKDRLYLGGAAPGSWRAC